MRKSDWCKQSGTGAVRHRNTSQKCNQIEVKSVLLEYLLIFFARVCDVTLSTVRMILVVRGKRYPAAAIGSGSQYLYHGSRQVMRNIDVL